MALLGDTEVVLTWVRGVLVPELKAGHIVMLDNASFHKSPLIKEAIELAGCELWFLPVYSPDKPCVVLPLLRTVGLGLRRGYAKWRVLYSLYLTLLMRFFNSALNYSPSYSRTGAAGKKVVLNHDRDDKVVSVREFDATKQGKSLNDAFAQIEAEKKQEKMMAKQWLRITRFSN